MSDAILCPQVGQDLTSAKVVSLSVKLGDKVKKGDIVAVVESEKASFDVEAFSEGVVTALPFNVGENATVLEPLIVLGKEGEAAAAPVASAAAAKPASVVNLPKPTHAPVYDADGGVRSSPLARRMAESNGLDIAKIAGTGPHGAVVMRDVETQLSRQPLQQAPGAGGVAVNIKNVKRGSGDPVLFIHGFGADLTAWQKTSTTIGFPNTMLALDLPGHGASGELAQPGFASLVEAVAAALKSAGHTKLHLVGHSLGAAVCIALSARSDISVQSMTLISPAGLGPTIDGSFVDGFLAAKSEAALAVQMQRLVHDGSSLPAAVVRATHAAREGGSVAAQARLAEGLFEASTQLFSVKAELARFQKPVRVILGSRDGIIPSQESGKSIPPQVALHRLENVGHLPFMEAADLVERLICETVRSAG